MRVWVYESLEGDLYGVGPNDIHHSVLKQAPSSLCRYISQRINDRRDRQHGCFHIHVYPYLSELSKVLYKRSDHATNHASILFASRLATVEKTCRKEAVGAITLKYYG